MIRLTTGKPSEGMSYETSDCPPPGVNGAASVVAHPAEPGQGVGSPSPGAAYLLRYARAWRRQRRMYGRRDAVTLDTESRLRLLASALISRGVR